MFRLRRLKIPLIVLKCFGKVIQKQKERLEKQRAELTDAIDFCEEIKEEISESLIHSTI